LYLSRIAVWFLLAVGTACDVPKNVISIAINLQGRIFLNIFLKIALLGGLADKI
jgi:hypothetical protein